MRRRFRYFAALLTAIGVTSITDAVSAGDAPTAVLLLDGSGSMWARLPPDNRAKIDIVREKLTTILQTPSSTRVGLVSFGHRRRGDCSDVEVIAPPVSVRDGVLGPIAKLNPSFYIESQGAFAQRFATEMSSRLAVACPVTLLQQEEFSEPMVRINTDRIDGAELGWSETTAWDAEAEFYRQTAK